MKFWARKVQVAGPDCLVPADDASLKIFDKLPFDKDLEVETKQPRNIRFHRLVFGLVNKIAEGLDADPENVRHELCIHIGWFETITLRDGSTDRRPKSWAFASMDELEFKKLFDDLVRAVYEIWNILPSDIRREVNELLDVRDPK